MTAERRARACEHTRVRHQHGTRAAYKLDRCRCRPCSEANVAYEADRRRRIAYGRPGNLVDAGPAREHVARLAAAGMGLRTIAAASGVAHTSLQLLLHPRQGADPRPQRTRITRDTEQRILTVQFHLAGGASVDSTGSRRRLQALTALGWSMGALGHRLGCSAGRTWQLATMTTPITQQTADRIRALYDELWDQPQHGTDRGTRSAATRARKRAAANGWPPPLAWDDETIDDPAAVAELGTPGRKNAALDPEDVRWLHDQGESVLAIATRFGVSCDYVEQRLRLTAGGAAA